MRLLGSSYIYCWPAILILGLCQYSVVNGQKFSQFCKKDNPTNSDAVLVEVARIGRGMTWPLIPQLFLRVYNDGRIEYESLESNKLILKKAELDSTTIERLRRIIEARDLAESQVEYPMLEQVSDALMKTCVSYKAGGGQSRQILVVNFAPDHSRAKDYYAPSLVELLRMVEQIRPSNEYERDHSFDKLNFGWTELLF